MLTQSAVFLPQGRPPRPGQVHRQPRLAETLHAIASHGAKAFYEGPVAEDIVTKLRSVGGRHTEDDFARASVDYVTPIRARYRGVDVYECPPNGQGIIALLMLNILGRIRTSWLGSSRPGAISTWRRKPPRLAFCERAARLADPEHADVPVEALLSEAHAETMRARIHPDRMTAGLEPPALPEHRDTVYLSVVDAERNAISFINSLFHSFGSGIFAPRSGVMLHNRGAGFVLERGHPNGADAGQAPDAHDHSRDGSA